MSVLSDSIEVFIKDMLLCGEAELQRNELASQFGCAPSQINYVLTTRFSLERGYIITSKRGGGGYIRITRVEMERDSCVYELVCGIGETLGEKAARDILLQLFDLGAITTRETALMLSAIGNIEPSKSHAHARAKLMRAMLTAIMKQNASNDNV